MNKYLFKIKYILCTLIVLITAIGCYKDKGNYDLREINKISFVKNGSDSIQINQFDMLMVEPSIDQTMSHSEDNLDHKWTVYLHDEPMSGVIHEELAQTKNLNVQFGLRPDRYTLLYTVTDRNTGVSEFKKYFLQVGSKLSEGWLMISEDIEGDRDVDLLHPEGYVIERLLSSANPSVILPKGLHKISVLTTFFGGSQDIFLMGEDDAMRVRYVDFTKINELKDWFVEGQPIHKPQDYAYDMVGGNAFYMDNGKLYSNQVDFRYGNAVTGNYRLAPFIYPSQSGESAVVYDQIKKRFLSYQRKVLNEYSSGGAFDMNNVGLTALFAGPAPGNQFSYLMKGEADDYYVVRVHQGGAEGKYSVNKAENIHKVEHVAFSGLYFHIYYSVDNKVYLLDVSNNTSTLVYTFPSSETISALSIKQSNSSFVGYPDNNRTLAIGTYDGNEGKVYAFSIDNIGKFVDDTYFELYTGLQKPISLTYKNRK